MGWQGDRREDSPRGIFHQSHLNMKGMAHRYSILSKVWWFIWLLHMRCRSSSFARDGSDVVEFTFCHHALLNACWKVNANWSSTHDYLGTFNTSFSPNFRIWKQFPYRLMFHQCHVAKLSTQDISQLPRSIAHTKSIKNPGKVQQGTLLRNPSIRNEDGISKRVYPTNFDAL